MMVPAELSGIEEQLLALYFERRPFTAGQLGIRWGRGAMPPITEARNAELATGLREVRARLASVLAAGTREPELTDEHRLTARMMDEIAGYEIDTATAGWPRFTVSSLPEAGASAQLLAFLPYAVVQSAEDLSDYRSQCQAIDTTLAEADAELSRGRESGQVPVRRLVQGAARQIADYLSTPVHDDRFLATLGAADDQLARRIRAAFERHRTELLTEVMPTARPDSRPGLCWIPGGEQTYVRAVHAYTTLRIGPQRCHEIGLLQVGELRERAERIAGTLGWTGDFDQTRERMRADPALRFRDADEILSTAGAAMDRATRATPTWIGDLPKATCTVLPMDPIESPQGVPGHYETAPLDRHRPARYWVNVADPGERYRFDAEALAFHESMPGHHLEIATSQERPTGSEFRRLVEVLPFTEGWALYAEGLADEMGLYTGDLDRLGMVSFALWRAARLVVDTGLHLHGWSRQEAVDFLLRNTFLTRTTVDNEVDRYIAHPGSALGYQLGRTTIEQLRARLVADPTDPGQLREFHVSLLQRGPLTLTCLAEALDCPEVLDR